TVRDSRFIGSDAFEQQFRSKLEHCAIIAAIHRMSDTVWFRLVEKQNMIRVGHELASCDLFQKHSRAREDNMMSVRMFFRAMLPAFRAADDVVNRDAPAAIKRMGAQAHRCCKLMVADRYSFT